MFEQLIEGTLPCKTLVDTTEDEIYSQDYPGPGLASFQNMALAGNIAKSNTGSRPKETPSFCNPSRAVPGSSWGYGVNTPGNMKINAFSNPIMRQAEDLTQRTMLLQSPEDPDVTNLIQDDSEAQLALFLSKTLTNAIMIYRRGGPGPIGPPAGIGTKKGPGPIAPPQQRGGPKGGPVGRGTKGPELNEFYADNTLAPGRGGSGGGLYGLSEPLLQYSQPGASYSSSMEPPYKRKYEDW